MIHNSNVTHGLNFEVLVLCKERFTSTQPAFRQLGIYDLAHSRDAGLRFPAFAPTDSHQHLPAAESEFAVFLYRQGFSNLAIQQTYLLLYYYSNQRSHCELQVGFFPGSFIDHRGNESDGPHVSDVARESSIATYDDEFIL